MNIKDYLQKKQQQENLQNQYRLLCDQCRQPGFGCYCEHVVKFDPKIKFVILMHPIERRRRIATGRMSHLSLKDSELIVGESFANDYRLNAILNDPKYNCIVLYPGVQATNISHAESCTKESLFEEGKKTVIIVIDGTWATAKKMMNRSPNLKSLNRICFTPVMPSRFRVRKQPRAECFSTIEAIHYTIELIGSFAGYDVKSGIHRNLLNVFDKMVERQLEFMREAFESPNTTSYRKVKKRVA